MAKKKNKVNEHIELMWLEGVRLDTPDKGWAQRYSYVSSSSTKRYYNCLYLLCRLSPCSRNLMDYLSEVMDDENIVDTSKMARDKFNDFISSITNGKVSYKDITIKKAITELKLKHLINQISIGKSKVNPLYFFKGSDEERIKKIKLIISIGSKLGDAFKWESEDRISDEDIKMYKAVAVKNGGDIVKGKQLEDIIEEGGVTRKINL